MYITEGHNGTFENCPDRPLAPGLFQTLPPPEFLGAFVSKHIKNNLS